MIERIRSKKMGGGSYFDGPAAHLTFIPTGCILLDLVVGGGWPLGRMVNIIGDNSTGKTLLAIEACANFAARFPKGKIFYRETEAAFDKGYAEALGMPLSRIDFGDGKFDTVEEVFEDLERELATLKNVPGLYIIDSLDALSDRAEMGRKIDEKTYGGDKAKMIGQLFRRLTRKVEQSQVCFIIVSQTRAKIGAMFGDKTTCSGGAALQFYASQRIKLAHLAQIVETSHGQKRTVGVRIKAKCVKNKIGLPFRECEFIIRFAFGVESYEAAMTWLIGAKQTKRLGISIERAKQYIDEAPDWSPDEYATRNAELEAAVTAAWREIERDFLPRRKKYG